MKPRKIGCLLLLCLSATLLLACVTEERAGRHIRKNSRIEFYLNREANLLSEIAVRRTFQNWAEKTHFTAVYQGRHGAGLRRDGKNTVSFLLRWPAEIPINKVAYCKNWFDSDGHIVESDIIFNMMIAKFTTLKSNTPDSYFIEGVLAHEIGHLIGLDHIDDPSSVMKYKSDMTESYFKGDIDDLTLAAYRDLYKIR